MSNTLAMPEASSRKGKVQSETLMVPHMVLLCFSKRHSRMARRRTGDQETRDDDGDQEVFNFPILLICANKSSSGFFYKSGEDQRFLNSSQPWLRETNRQSRSSPTRCRGERRRRGLIEISDSQINTRVLARKSTMARKPRAREARLEGRIYSDPSALLPLEVPLFDHLVHHHQVLAPSPITSSAGTRLLVLLGQTLLLDRRVFLCVGKVGNRISVNISSEFYRNN
jgi:hypothetical protein